MPSSSAAFVAQSASLSLSFTSLTSTSEAPPTLMTATPPVSFARRSLSLSFSYCEEVPSMASRMVSHRSSMASFKPAPSNMMLSSLVIVTDLQVPSCKMSRSSSFSPRSSETMCAPVSTARSCSMALRLSPKPGAFTAATFRPPRSLLTISIARASPSMSSAITSNGFCTLATCSRIGRMEATEEILLLQSRMRGFSSSTR
mmetsp:Transcript_29857/g.79462  ORF Transcript_29857/g.79462 Transcript_29857/m.79462 type:complete len:201 (-) Transcript_29857:809-1411(-)